MHAAEPRPCPRCGYDLTGLARRGRCPECGQFYDLAYLPTRSPDNESFSRRSDRIAARLRTIALALLTLFALICGGLLSAYIPNRDRAIAYTAIFVFLGLLATLTSYFYEKDT
ncbi:MAG TPA: hypothetical protein VF184_06315 [Phycisphaeraceae bacterium]